MAINWRQREPILRVLAAVYAELGEDAFKGRYDKIARLYGDAASYSAIKSFFSKEIVKLAEDMKARAVNSRDEFTEVHAGQRSSVVRRPIHITFDEMDDEVVIIGERRADPELLSVRSVKSPEQERISLDVFRGTANPASQARESLDLDLLDPQLRPPEEPKTSFSAEKEKQVSGTGTRIPTQRRKRPHSAIEESDHPTLSFGYVTSEGRHRCALCMTELPNAYMLKKHESLSELHLTNLKDPAIVFRGQTALAEHNSLSDNTSRQQSRPNPAIANAAAFFRRHDPDRNMRRSYSRHRQQSHEVAVAVAVSNEVESSSGTRHVPQPSRARVETTFLSNGNLVADHEDARNDPEISIVESSGKGKAKESVQLSLDNEQAASSIEAPIHPQPENTAPTPQHDSLSDIFQQRLGEYQRLNDVPPTWIAQTLLSSGMELLAKKCIEEHPELNAVFYRCMQDIQGTRKSVVPEHQAWRSWDNAVDGGQNSIASSH